MQQSGLVSLGAASVTAPGLLVVLTAVVTAAAGCGREPAIEPPQDALVIRAARQLAWRLDYVAADYGLIGSHATAEERQRETDEQLAYLDEAVAIGAALPALDADAEIKPLIELIEARAPSAEVAELAARVSDRALSAHRVVLAPLGDPDLERAAGLFRENCSKCHGSAGAGDGREAGALKIKPRSFLDPAIMEPMTPRRVFSALTDGIAAAEMPQFDLLAADDRWSLSFYVMTLRFAEREAGAATPAASATVTVAELANQSDSELRARLGDDSLAWARIARPFRRQTGPLVRAQEALVRSIAEHRAGKRAEAASRIDAILSDGFPAFRPAVSARSSSLSWRIERALDDLRAAIPDGAAPELEQRALAIRLDLRVAARTAARVSPLALAGVATVATLGPMIVLLFIGWVAARSMRVPRAGRAIALGFGIAVVAGLATLLSPATGELVAASSRHQIVAASRLISSLAALGAMVVVVRRLATVIERPSHSSGLPWWLATLSFVCAYGSVLEWSHQVSQLAAETGSAAWQLALSGAVAAIVVAAMIGLVLELVARLGGRLGSAPQLGVAAVVALVCAVSLAGASAGGLVAGGTIGAARLGAIHGDLFAISPHRWVAIAQLSVVGIGLAITGWGLLAAEPAARRASARNQDESGFSDRS